MDKQVVFKNDNDLKVFLATNYMTQIKNFFGEEKQAMKFLSSVMAAVQKTPNLIKCESITVVNSFMTMAQLGLMPSDVSGEAYVLPYNGKAQFQLGYQGLVTLFYRAGVSAIYADIVRENDELKIINGNINHNVDHTKSMRARGKAIGAYVVINYKGNLMGKYMHGDDIVAHGANFSKSFKSEYSPWNEKNDPELWMWKKTVLKQAAKLMPKNETINHAIKEDNQESRISEVKPLLKSNELQMGNFLKTHENKEIENKNEGSEGSDTDFRPENAIKD
jgi:recombination protein RecT